MSSGPRVDACNGRVHCDQCGGITTVNIQDSQPTAPGKQGKAAMLQMVVSFGITDPHVWPIRVVKHLLNDGLVHRGVTVSKHPVRAGQSGRLECHSQACGPSHCYTDVVPRESIPAGQLVTLPFHLRLSLSPCGPETLDGPRWLRAAPPLEQVVTIDSRIAEEAPTTGADPRHTGRGRPFHMFKSDRCSRALTCWTSCDCNAYTAFDSSLRLFCHLPPMG